MIDGELKCIGISADLKNRYGEGYKLSIQTARGKPEEPADEFVRKIAPGAVLVNKLSGTRNYQVPKGIFSLDYIFSAMEENKEKLSITDWAITNTTLEEVFLQISKERRKKEKNKGKEKFKDHLVDLP